MTPYEKPMECGNHEDVRWAKLISNKGDGLLGKRGTDLLQVLALPYTDEEMDTVACRIDLPKSSVTVLCVSHKPLALVQMAVALNR